MAKQLPEDFEQLASNLEALDYYAILRLDSSVDYIEVRAQFHKCAQRYHPDRFLGAAFDGDRSKIYAVYKRMTEANRVLVDPELRVAYDEGLRVGATRLDPDIRARRLTGDARALTSSFARVYLNAAKKKFDAEDWQGAAIDAELGLSVEHADVLKDLHTEAVRRMVRSRGPK